MQTEIERWPEWQPEVSRSRLDGPLEPGSVFRWTSGGWMQNMLDASLSTWLERLQRVAEDASAVRP